MKIPKAVGRVLERLISVAEDDTTLRTYVFDSNVNVRSVSACLKQLNEWAAASKAPIEIVLHSPGGDVDSGFRFIEEVRHLRRTHTVTTRASGLAASMAGLMLQAGSVRKIGHESTLHLHPPSSGVWGNVHEIREKADRLGLMYDRMIALYAGRGNLSADEIRREVDSRIDWYIPARQAIELGFADELFS
ncbi:ATP-dependent Clp protease proteolytic subunit [Kribbella sp. NBC_01505]|uniref:ATP-dependent Clp protease proteolytic subunit n=1 Tax=Kribbella sp. NBC_01505 TaxID=2903580 RepID=UPI003864D5EF